MQIFVVAFAVTEERAAIVGVFREMWTQAPFANRFADVNNSMTIMQEEIFGPVLCIMPVDTEEEALAIANDSPYGLSHYVHSQDGARRNHLARRLRSGMVDMNGMGGDSGSPFGGMKASGNGREGGTWGLQEFCEVKAITGWANAEEKSD
jgi:aldehyde dehydrogenase (NAD+)